MTLLIFHMQLCISEIPGITCSLSAELCSRNLSHVGTISDVTLDTTPFARKFVFTQCLGNAGATPCFWTFYIWHNEGEHRISHRRSEIGHDHGKTERGVSDRLFTGYDEQIIELVGQCTDAFHCGFGFPYDKGSDNTIAGWRVDSHNVQNMHRSSWLLERYMSNFPGSLGEHKQTSGNRSK